MRGGALPPALLACALGFALAFAARRAMGPAIAVFVVTATAVAFAPAPRGWSDAIFYACWASVLLTAMSVNLPTLRPAAALGLSANAGFWTGAVIAVAGEPLDLAKALPLILVAFPTAWLVERKFGIAVKVVASWLAAVSVLAAAVPAFTPIPGYVGDHRE